MDAAIDRDYALQPELCRKINDTIIELMTRYRIMGDISPSELYKSVNAIYDSVYGLLDDETSELLTLVLAESLRETTDPTRLTAPLVVTDSHAIDERHAILVINIVDSDLIISVAMGDYKQRVMHFDSHLEACERAKLFITKRNLKDWEKLC